MTETVTKTTYVYRIWFVVVIAATDTPKHSTSTDLELEFEIYSNDDMRKALKCVEKQYHPLPNEKIVITGVHLMYKK